MHHSPPRNRFQAESRVEKRSYRKVKQLPETLLTHCTTCIEEGLFSQGISVLSTSLTSGTGSAVEAQIPPIQHLALAATLVVHPQLTSRTKSPEKHAAADDALRYLRQVNGLVGPRNASLDKAFLFPYNTPPSRGKRAKPRESGALSHDADGTLERIESSYAHKGSLWTNADDFWSIIGWAFNCSVAYRHRWDRWKLLLDFLLDVIEADLEERLPEATHAYRSGGVTALKLSLTDCLFTRYLSPIGEGRNNKRRLMRAILADGTQKSLAEFGEIWKNETKLPKVKEDDRVSKRRKLDLENGEFGDYFDDSDEEEFNGSVRRSRSTTAIPNAQSAETVSDEDEEASRATNGTKTPTGPSNATAIEAFGGMDAIRLRQRILALFARFCALNPDEFLDNEDLFDLYTEFLRPLPLPVFQQFVLPAKPYLLPQTQASLNQMVLRPLLAATAPDYSDSPVTQEVFEAHYAPHGANNTSAVDNAKVSLLSENLLRFLWNSGSLNATRQLRDLLEQGIAARREKVAFDGRKKVGAKIRVDEEAITVLECSAERMIMVLDMAD